MSRYSEKVKTKSTVQLEAILGNRKDYVQELVLAAALELESRGGESLVGEVSKEHQLKEVKISKSNRNKVKTPPIPRLTMAGVILIILSCVISFLPKLFFTKVQGVSFSINMIAVFMLAIAWGLYKRSNTMRWTWTIMYGLGFLISVIFSMGFNMKMNLISINSLLQLIATILLHLKVSNDWFRGHAKETEDQFIFKD